MEHLQVFTIGHSNHDIEHFLDLLKLNKIEALVDIRSNPFSAYSPHFDLPTLRAAIKEWKISYLYMGKELGGRPESRLHYDADGHALYGKMAESPTFQEGIERILQGITAGRVAIMCSEEDPKDCHRRLLVGRVLAGQGVQLNHIRGNGRIEIESEVPLSELTKLPTNQQPLFTTLEADSWKSIRSVSRGNRRPNSSRS